MQIETAKLKKEKIANPHENYLQALKTWDENRQSADECKIALKYNKKDLLINFEKYEMITKFITKKHAHWQIDTIQKLLQRNESFQYVKKLIRVKEIKSCHACSGKSTTNGTAHRLRNKPN